MGDIQLDYVVPSPDLAAYVTVFYRFAADLAALDERERADFAQLRFCLSPGGGGYRFAAGDSVDAPPIHLLAASHGVRGVWARGPVSVFGLGLTPAGWGALVGDRGRREPLLDAAALLGPSVRAAGAALAHVSDAAAMATLVEPALRGLIGLADPRVLAFTAAVDGWLVGSASPDLAALAAVTGLSRRQVERRCNQLYGAAPKRLARKVRALRAAVALASGGATVDALIADGFYDQSHLIRELKQFTGLTPRQLREEPGMLARLTMTRRHALHGRVGLLVSDT